MFKLYEKKFPNKKKKSQSVEISYGKQLENPETKRDSAEKNFSIPSSTKYRDFKLQLNYLQRQLKIFNNLCFGRNYINMKKLKNQLTLPLLMDYIWNCSEKDEEMYQG